VEENTRGKVNSNKKGMTRRQAIKAGGLGLAFATPVIQTIIAQPAFASYGGGPNPQPPRKKKRWWW
jgi:hypothetical protein